MFVGLRNLLLLFACLVVAGGQAWAVALGKIEVTSHLGETFYAEAPIELDAGEKISAVSVELADASDYRILEVFRDPALSKLSVDVVNDSRGPRAVIKSTDAVDTPYFNLVLKLHYGHATNFKKYPVFLDLPEQLRPAAPVAQQQAGQQAAPASQPAAQVAATPTKPQPQPQLAKTEPKAAAAPAGFQAYDGWARTSRYGPMVRGDNITTVAHRLAIDKRFAINQIMVALYDRNKDKFRANNINLINAGTYLDVPTAKQVEAISEHDATAFMRKQNAEWKQLQKQPLYAAEAEAQKNRYRTRVHMGESATGTAAAPLQAGQQQSSATQAQAAPEPSVKPVQGGAGEQAMKQQLLSLQQENQQLKQALQASQTKAAESKPASEGAAAAEEQVKKLELTVARLQHQLRLVNQQMQEVQAQKMNSVTYVLSGIILLLIAVAGYLLYLLRRDRPHPSVNAAPAGEAETGAEAAFVTATEDAAEAVGQNLETDASGQDIGGSEPSGQDDTQVAEGGMTKAQADVDYLAEAEVYLRYGMDDEALQQMHLAIEQKPDNLQAHGQLVKFLQARNDQSATEEAIEAARSMLSGDDLQAFEEGLSGMEETTAEESPESTEEAAATDDAIDMDLMPELQATPDMDAAMQEAMAAMAGEEGEGEETASADSEEASGELDESVNLDDLALPRGDEEAEEAPVETDEAGDEANLDLSALAEESAEGLDFVGSTEISPSSEGEAEEAGEVQSGVEMEGLDFSLSEESPSVEADNEPAAETGGEEEGLAFEVPSVEAEEGEEGELETGKDASDEENALDLGEPLNEFDTLSEGETEAGTDMELAGDEARPADLSSTDEEGEPEAPVENESDTEEGAEELLSGNEVRPFDSDAADEDEVPETLLENESDAGDVEELLGGFIPRDEGEDKDVEAFAGQDNKANTETSHDVGAFNLDDILGEFEADADVDSLGASEAEAGASTVGSDEMPEMDVSNELDDLLAEWGDEGKDFEAGPQSLDMDRARSLLAEDRLGEAEEALNDALAGARRGDALIGLAEVAARRGDQARKAELLAEAEPLVDESNREWFDTVSKLSF